IMLCLPLVPLLNNAYNRDLVRSVGAAEQTGHDFGWQFGNYQLRGADAFCEELDPNEEPLPNPLYPEEMTQDAIFFGGTDPGRFVPTYMIYSAQVRPDVYLITQNALADNTYMNVMRDLYGDDIWIPAQPDSALAFQRYVNEVRTGKRPKNAELIVREGRVQISGALGVMEINGILAEMIFEYNNHKHDFYVEESYVIKWMYPYITPHGLIMKINKEKTTYTPENIRNDRDLWDWYTRRLLSNTKFTRDVVARKSFSKLRSALAGAYTYRRNTPMAERAFHEARMLYPLSPEANFRLAQDVYIKKGQFDDAMALIEDLQQRDPNSTRPQSFLKQIGNIKGLSDQIKTLEVEKKAGKMDVGKAIKLSALYIQANRLAHFNSIANDILKINKFPSPVYLNIASLAIKARNIPVMNKALELCILNTNTQTDKKVFLNVATFYARTKQIPKAEKTLTLYLKKSPTDWKALLDLASMQMMQEKSNEALRTLQQAITYGGNNALKLIHRDRQFQSIRSKLKTNGQQPPLLDMGGILPR
ncbi:MAG: hypothetical protein KAH23_08305, partial [Kiritimatiellae bacterium]|nr:hypothetical protein [Kiritimatiellia bacterium]